MLDRDEVAQWIVTNAPADTTAEHVAENLLRSGASARIDPNGQVFAPFRVAPVDELRPSTLGLRRALDGVPHSNTGSTRWIGHPRISWPGMSRHVQCMVPEYRADDRRFIPTTIRKSSMNAKAKGAFLAQHPRCELCGDPSQVVDHSHSTGLVRGALCAPCNTHLGLIEKLCEPIVERIAAEEGSERHLNWRSNWLAPALAYTHHDPAPVHQAYRLSP